MSSLLIFRGRKMVTLTFMSPSLPDKPLDAGWIMGSVKILYQCGIADFLWDVGWIMGSVKIYVIQYIEN